MRRRPSSVSARPESSSAIASTRRSAAPLASPAARAALIASRAMGHCSCSSAARVSGRSNAADESRTLSRLPSSRCASGTIAPIARCRGSDVRRASRNTASASMECTEPPRSRASARSSVSALTTELFPAPIGPEMPITFMPSPHPPTRATPLRPR